ncbi:MAG TPA: NAD-dependent epimerase/dehydratase family protein [Polyangiaceae bacterium]|jgi:nucleoside-diphosphate-sugar epimerase|nr:NAD-dependent epimerase/dehydratase family protein [Polyangiaceae bacterium]
MTELVTGATGFIGRHLTERLLREGREVRVLCRPGSEHKLSAAIAERAQIVRGDLRDEVSLRAAVTGVSRLFHCAGQVSDWGTLADFEATNVRGTEALYQAARGAGVERVIHFSSIAVFGTPSPPYFDDASPVGGEGRDRYSITKASGEAVAMKAFEAGLPLTILRPAVVFGQHGKWLEEPLAMIEAGRMFLLGGGRGTCHPCYIENLIDATLIAAEHPRALGEAFIVGDGESISFREYFDAVASIAGRNSIRRSIPLGAARVLASVLETGARLGRATERPLLTHAAIDMVTTSSEMSTRKVREVLGFRPRYAFRDAIEELRAQYRDRASLSQNRRPP